MKKDVELMNKYKLMDYSLLLAIEKKGDDDVKLETIEIGRAHV